MAAVTRPSGPAGTSRWLTARARRRTLRFGRLGRTLPALSPPALLALATAAFCWKLLVAGLVVIGYDTMTYMYPYRFFAAEALRQGRIPLWNPYIFYGVPFLANLQSAVFYPPHLLFLVMPATSAMNWSVAVHLFLAALFAYVAGRVVVGLDRTGATVAGALYGLSGFVGAQVGHLNQLNAAAWLPAALVTLHLALSRRSPRWVAASAVVLAVQLLAGHAQESYMTLLLLAGYAAFFVLWQGIAGRSALALLREALWAAVAYGLAAALAGGLAAVQLLPTNELTALSIRAGGMTFGEASSFSLPPRELFVGLLPTFGYAAPTSNEYLGWIGFGGLTLSLLGLLFHARRPGTLFFAIVVLVSFLLALGNHFPLYERVFRIPGFNLFRVPARWLLLTSFGLAMLAGSGLAFLHRLGRGGSLDAAAADGVAALPAGPWRRLAAAARLLLGLLIVIGAGALLWPMQRIGGDGDLGPLPALWITLGATAVASVFWALAAAPSRWPAAAIAGGVFLELFAASRSLEYNNPNPPTVYTAPRPVLTALWREARPERIVSIAGTGYHPSDAAQLVAGYEPLLGPNGVLATLINTKFKEILSPNLSMVFHIPTVDGYDGGILPLRRYVEYKQLVVPAELNYPDGLLRDQLRRVPDAPHLRQLGVRYVLVDAIADVTRDGVYYDLAGTVTLGPSETTRLEQFAILDDAPAAAPGRATAVGIVTSLQGVTLPDGEAAATVIVGGDAGVLWQADLIVGRDSAEGRFVPSAGRQQPPPLGPAGAAGTAAATYLARLEAPPNAPAAPVRWVAVQSLLRRPQETVSIHAVTVIGAGGQSWPVTLAGDGALRLVHHSDVKLYRNERALPRAYLAPAARVVDDGGAAIAALGQVGHDLQRTVLLERDPGAPPLSRSTLRARARRLVDGVKSALGVLQDPRAGTVPAGTPLPAGAEPLAAAVSWVQDEPEQIELATDSPRAGLLVLRDTWYPGWSATVDGQVVPVYRADGLFRAVSVPAGRHTVRFTFRSVALERGALLATLAALATLLTAAAAGLRTPRWLAPFAARRRLPDGAPTW